eukprot:13508565-Ditylum_brightwellii.AAC.1
MLALTTFKSELLKLGTAPIIKQVMHYKIMQWCHMPTISAPRIANNEIGEAICGAIEDQHCIGWDNFMKGRISIKWKISQQLFHNTQPTPKN